MMTNGRRQELRKWLEAELERFNAEAARAGEAVRDASGRYEATRRERAHNHRVTPERVAEMREAAREAERIFGRAAAKTRGVGQLLAALDELTTVEERVMRQAQAVARNVPELHELANAF
jgi:K+/H+ antiporter YhaU regulatory subunit KhtT